MPKNLTRSFEVNEPKGRVPSRLEWNSQASEGSETEQMSGESLPVGAGCLRGDRLSISGPRRPEQQVHRLR